MGWGFLRQMKSDVQEQLSLICWFKNHYAILKLNCILSDTSRVIFFSYFTYYRQMLTINNRSVGIFPKKKLQIKSYIKCVIKVAGQKRMHSQQPIMQQILTNSANFRGDSENGHLIPARGTN